MSVFIAALGGWLAVWSHGWGCWRCAGWVLFPLFVTWLIGKLHNPQWKFLIVISLLFTRQSVPCWNAAHPVAATGILDVYKNSNWLVADAIQANQLNGLVQILESCRDAMSETTDVRKRLLALQELRNRLFRLPYLAANTRARLFPLMGDVVPFMVSFLVSIDELLYYAESALLETVNYVNHEAIAIGKYGNY